ncbi:hypothetical protein EDD17DRAFT_1593530 [Pisolithus thermaeus]|nr:hypothetical protein EDD17DRAFT_1593530 [Pisolithus thermaeus]
MQTAADNTRVGQRSSFKQLIESLRCFPFGNRKVLSCWTLPSRPPMSAQVIGYPIPRNQVVQYQTADWFSRITWCRRDGSVESATKATKRVRQTRRENSVCDGNAKIRIYVALNVAPRLRTEDIGPCAIILCLVHWMIALQSWFAQPAKAVQNSAPSAEICT